MARTAALAAVFWLGAMVGCGGGNKNTGYIPGAGGTAGGAAGSGGTVSDSGVDGTKVVSALTMDEKGKICDWFASLVGGYGMTNTCGMGSFYPPDTKDNCVSQFASCAATVSDLEGCTKAQADAGKMCTDAAFAMAGATAACKTVLADGC